MKPEKNHTRSRNRRAASITSSASRSITRARSSISFPAGVTSTRFLFLSNSVTPIAASICAICALSEGCATWHITLALRKLNVSATATAYCICRSEKGCASLIVIPYQYDPILVLDAIKKQEHDGKCKE